MTRWETLFADVLWILFSSVAGLATVAFMVIALNGLPRREVILTSSRVTGMDLVFVIAGLGWGVALVITLIIAGMMHSYEEATSR